MKDIFSELYKKVLSFFNSEEKEENSKETACNRLKLVLMQDRAKMEPALMEKMREEMIEVISKYVEIDTEALDLNLEAEGDSFALMLNIPVLRAKTREEIEAQEGIINDEDEDEDIDEEEVIAEAETEDDEAQSGEDETPLDNSQEETSQAQESEEELPLTENEDNQEEIKQDLETDKKAETEISEKPANQKPQITKKKIKHQKDDDL